MSSQDYKFEGWLASDASAINGTMQWKEFEPKAWEETDIDIKITHCGICGSDLHTLRSGWGPTNYPCCVGHEIVGIAVRVGSQAEGGIKVGDRVGVGAQGESCLGRKGPCEDCASGNERFCGRHWAGTYDGIFMNGSKSYGGYSLYNRSPSHFVVKIPDALSSAAAAPMLCGGATTYTPLKKNGCGLGKAIGVIGVGGLGHFAILFARALGADKVVAVSRKGNKRDDALKLGATSYIATDEDENWAQKYDRSLDLIISTVSSSKMPLIQYVSLLKVNGTLIQLGNPDDGSLVIPAGVLIIRGAKLGGSVIGSPSDIREMLELAAEKKLKPWVEERPMKDANNAIVDMDKGNARYRYVLVNDW